MPDPKKWILLVEDDEDVRDSVRDVIEMAGYAVRCAANGKVALELLHASESVPCLILLDLMMPVMDGSTFCVERTKVERLKGVPVVFMSADGKVDEKAARVGASGGLKKPTTIEAILEVVEKFCGRP